MLIADVADQLLQQILERDNTDDACVLIDPLTVKDLQPLWSLLDEPRRLKVLHAARQDLEVMSQAPRADKLDGSIPSPLFDTQLAAAFRRLHVDTIIITAALFNQVAREEPSAFGTLSTVIAF